MFACAAMHTHQKSSDAVATIGIDIGKNPSTWSVSTSAAPSCCGSRYHAANWSAGLPACRAALSGWKPAAARITSLGRSDVRLIPTPYTSSHSSRDTRTTIATGGNRGGCAAANHGLCQLPTLDTVQGVGPIIFGGSFDRGTCTVPAPPATCV